MNDIVTARVVIEGRVQCVWFRGWTVDEATKLGLNGWVRNRPDGTVEALLSGDEGKVGEMLRRCKIGPILAKVTNTTEHEAEAPNGAGFRQLPT